MVLSGEFYEVEMITSAGLKVVRNIYGTSPENARDAAYRIYAYLVIKSITVGERV